MYRPPTTQTYDRIQTYMTEHECSWNAAVHALVLRGLRALDGEQRRADRRIAS